MDPVIQRAREIAQQYNPDGLVPFPFQELASRLSDIELLYIETDEGISGAIYFQNGRYTILINSNNPETRQYFTTAHELGHYFLHADWLRENGDNGFVDFSDAVDVQGMLLRPGGPSIDTRKEREANNFAAELIMPEDKVREFWALTHDIAACANAFLVSKSAMALRLEKLGIL